MKNNIQLERITLIKCMEFIARHVNDEEIFEDWLIYGVADGDIPFGELTVGVEDIDNLEWYIRDENYKLLCDSFLVLMKRAAKSGGLIK